MNGKSKLTIIIIILTLFYISSSHFTQAKTNNEQLSKLIIKSLENWREITEVGYEFYKRKRGIDNVSNPKKP